MLLKSFKIENNFLIEQEHIEFIYQIKHSAIFWNEMRIGRGRTGLFISHFK